MEPLELDDINFFPGACGYQVSMHTYIPTCIHIYAYIHVHPRIVPWYFLAFPYNTLRCRSVGSAGIG